MATIHLAQVNVARARAPLDDPRMRAFVDQLEAVNALADRSPGFVWRLQTGEGNATYLRPYPDDDCILFNMSVWESVDALRAYVYRGAHADAMKQRREWFEAFDRVYLALWWVPAGHVPGIEEAKERLAHLEAHGPTPVAFTFKQIFEPPALLQAVC